MVKLEEEANALFAGTTAVLSQSDMVKIEGEVELYKIKRLPGLGGS